MRGTISVPPEARDCIEEVRAQLGDRVRGDAPKIVTPPPTRRRRGR